VGETAIIHALKEFIGKPKRTLPVEKNIRAGNRKGADTYSV